MLISLVVELVEYLAGTQATPQLRAGETAHETLRLVPPCIGTVLCSSPLVGRSAIGSTLPGESGSVGSANPRAYL